MWKYKVYVSHLPHSDSRSQLSPTKPSTRPSHHQRSSTSIRRILEVSYASLTSEEETTTDEEAATTEKLSLKQQESCSSSPASQKGKKRQQSCTPARDIRIQSRSPATLEPESLQLQGRTEKFPLQVWTREQERPANRPEAPQC